MTALCEHERVCNGCGEPFWGGPRANFCSAACRCRRWRAKQAQRRAVELHELCEEVGRRVEEGSASYSKLLPRLLRATAAELRRLGWEPIELLLSHPPHPAAEGDSAPGGIEGEAPERRRWLYPPDQELLLIEEEISDREARGVGVAWHRRRQAHLIQLLAARGASAPSALSPGSR